MKSKGNFQFSVGGSSILMIFVVLCLTTFGVLSYVTANADCKISTKNAETVQSYYKASALVQTNLQQIDTALLSAKLDAKKAVDAGNCDGLEHKSTYPSSSELAQIFNSSLPKDQKYAVCYRVFSQALVAKSSKAVFGTAQEDDDTLHCSLSTNVDQNRKVQVELEILPYTSTERYQITNEKVISSQADVDSEATLQLWQGSMPDQNSNSPK